jgi:hypothetical protein
MRIVMPSRRLKVACKDHYRQSIPLLQAVHQAGHDLVSAAADALLVDLDPPFYRHLIDAFADQGAKIVLYPHGGGGPVLSYDGLWEPYERVDANMVTGIGHAEFLRRIDYPTPVHVVGWSFCELRPFQPRTDIRDVVFAPTHPNGDGTMMEKRRELNAEVFARLLEGPWQVTVRFIGTLEQNGLWAEDGVEYVSAQLLTQTEQIDAADAVVAGDGTFPTLAIARGVPTVMYGQGTLALGLPDEEPTQLQRAERYLDYIRYPFDAEDGPLDEIVHAAGRSDAPIADWRRRFIGEPLDPRAVVAAIERTVAGEPPVQIDATRAFTTLALADELAERPELLRRYVDQVRPQDDASLILWAPGAGESQLMSLAEAAVAGAGLDVSALPDTLLVPLPGSPEVDRVLAERADAILSEWPAAGQIGALPRFSGLPAAV